MQNSGGSALHTGGAVVLRSSGGENLGVSKKARVAGAQFARGEVQEVQSGRRPGAARGLGRSGTVSSIPSVKGGRGVVLSGELIRFDSCFL